MPNPNEALWVNPRSSRQLTVPTVEEGIVVPPQARLIDNYSFREWKVRKQGAIFEKSKAWNFPENLIPTNLSSMHARRVLRRVSIEQVHVERSPLGGASLETDERWNYEVPPPSTSFSSEALNQVDRLASEMGIEPDLVVRAWIATRTLLNLHNDQNPIFLKFDRTRGEGLRFTPRHLVVLKKGIREQMGYGLEYYCEFFDPKEGQRARVLLSHMGFDKVDFETIFPYVLFFIAGFQKEEEDMQNMDPREIYRRLVAANTGIRG